MQSQWWSMRSSPCLGWTKIAWLHWPLPLTTSAAVTTWGHLWGNDCLLFTDSQRGVCLNTNFCPWAPQSQFKHGMGKSVIQSWHIISAIGQSRSTMTAEWSEHDWALASGKGAIVIFIWLLGHAQLEYYIFHLIITWVSTKRCSGPKSLCLMPGPKLTLGVQEFSDVGGREGVWHVQSSFVAGV